MMKPKLTPLEKSQVALHLTIDAAGREIAGVENSLETIRATHRPAMLKLHKKLVLAQTLNTETLAQIDRSLEWEQRVLRPLAIHLNELGRKWAGQSYSKVAFSHLMNTAALGEYIDDSYPENNPSSAIQKRVETFIDSAPFSLGVSDKANPFYPSEERRKKISEEMWATTLNEMTAVKNQDIYQEGVHSFLAYLEMYRDLVKCITSVLDGSLSKMQNSADADSLYKKQTRSLDKFIGAAEQDDSYKEDTRAKRAFMEVKKLQAGTKMAGSAKKSRRL